MNFRGQRTAVARLARRLETSHGETSTRSCSFFCRICPCANAPGPLQHAESKRKSVQIRETKGRGGGEGRGQGRGRDEAEGRGGGQAKVRPPSGALREHGTRRRHMLERMYRVRTPELRFRPPRASCDLAAYRARDRPAGEPANPTSSDPRRFRGVGKCARTVSTSAAASASRTSMTELAKKRLPRCRFRKPKANGSPQAFAPRICTILLQNGQTYHPDR
jgi:hypothetical protein